MPLPSTVPPLVAIDRASPAPIHRQIYAGYREAIVDGRLRAGERMPSTRALATELGVSRQPVLEAFEQLLAEGYCEARHGSGTFVATELPADRRPAGGDEEASPPATPRRAGSRRSATLVRPPVPWLRRQGPFNIGEIAFDRFPLATWSRLAARQARTMRTDELRYGEAAGLAELREAIAVYLRTARAVRCEPDQILIVSGSQQALEISARTVIDPGQTVWFEEPGYWGARDALTAAGARLVPVPVDEEGLDVAAGRRAAARARAVYVTPSHQFPLGATMSAGRRLQLLDWARRSGAWILEDDYDSELRFDRQPNTSLQSLDRDARVLFVGTFSKVLFPALRLGYLVVPPDLVERATAVRRVMDICPPRATQALVAAFLAEGHFARHLRRMREVYSERRQALVDAIEHHAGDLLEVVGDPAGMWLVALLRRAQDDVALAHRAETAGLRTMPLSRSYAGGRARNGFILGYGGARPAELAAAVRKLRRLLGPA
jgi:GntR family transcriptional regulator/MocR family aminotransferase